MKTALFTGIFRNEPLEAAARAAAEHGYDGLELRAMSHLKPDFSMEQVKDVRRIADHYGLSIPMLYTGIHGNYATAAREEAQRTIDAMRRYVDWAVELDIPMICHVPGGPAPELAGESDLDKAAHWLALLADYMHEAKLKLAMEIHHGGLLETIDGSLALVEKINRDHVGLILDPGNMAIAGEPYGADAVERIGRRLLHVHAKDVRFHPERKEGLGYYRQRCFSVELMGKGHVDHRPAYRALLDADYAGCVTLEAQPAGVPPDEIAAHEIRCFRQDMQDIQPGG